MGNSSFNYFGDKCKIGIGLKLSSSSLSRVVFLILGKQRPSLKVLGKIPLSNDKLTRDGLTRVNWNKLLCTGFQSSSWNGIQRA